jgi:hypothetical protein
MTVWEGSLSHFSVKAAPWVPVALATATPTAQAVEVVLKTPISRMRGRTPVVAYTLGPRAEVGTAEVRPATEQRAIRCAYRP